MATLNVKSSASGGGDGSSGDPYTLQEAFDNVSAGDTILVWVDSTYTISTQIDVDTTSGTAASPIEVNGANSSGTVDGTRPLIQADSSVSGTNLVDFDSGMNFYHFKFLTFDARDSGGTSRFSRAFDNSGAAFIGTQLFDVQFFGGTTRVADLQRTNVVKCEFAFGDSMGVFVNNTIPCLFDSCTFHDNGARGLQVWTSEAPESVVVNCMAYDNDGDGFMFDKAPRLCTRNVAFGNNGDGFEITDSTAGPEVTAIFNNSSSGNGGYGFNMNGMTAYVPYMDYNHTYNNTSGATDLAGGMPGDNNATGDPKFASTTDGSEDFTPQTGSPLLNAGLGVET